VIIPSLYQNPSLNLYPLYPFLHFYRILHLCWDYSILPYCS
jgi:hypothetical protein